MRKENIFLLTMQAQGIGNLEQLVVCSLTPESVHEYAKLAFPQKQILGAVSMAELESTLKGLKEALACQPGSHPVFVDPRMKSPSTPTQH